MPISLGNAILTLRVKGDEFRKGLANAKGEAGKTTKDIGSAFGRMQQRIQGAAGKIPIVGSSLAALATPAGLATAAIGLVVGGLIKMVTGVIRAEKELRPMIERSRIGGEALQQLAEAANRAGSEDGLEGVTDTAQELQLQLGELAATGGGRAKDALDALGLSAQALQDMEPEAAWRAVVAEIQKIPNVANRAIAAEEIFGGSSEKLAGIVNMTNAEFAGLLDTIEKTGDFLSDEQLEDARKFTEEITKLKDSFGGAANSIGAKLIPHLTTAVKFFNEELLPPIKDIANVLGPVLMPILRAVGNIFGGVIKTVLTVVANLLKGVAQVLTGDFSGAWESAKKIAQAVMNGIITVYNNTIGLIPGVSKLDMLEFADNIEIAEDAVKDLAVASGESAAETTKVYRESASEIAQVARQLTVDLEEEGKKRLASAREQMAEDYRIRQEAFAARLQLRKDFLEDEQKFHDDELTALRKQFDVTEVEYRVAQAQVESMTGAHYAELVALAEELGIDNLAVLHASNRKLAQAQLAADNARIIAAQETAATLAGIAGGGDRSGLTPGGLGYDAVSGGPGRKGGLDGEEIRKLLAQAEKQGKGAIIDPYNGTIYLVGGGRFTKGSGSLRGRDREDHDRRYNEVAAQHGFPAAQRGAFVKGSQQGSLVRVGENFTDENITPVGGRGGSGSGGGQSLTIPVQIGDETLATIYVKGKRVAVRENRD